jgi:hypothetical protein
MISNEMNIDILFINTFSNIIENNAETEYKCVML